MRIFTLIFITILFSLSAHAEYDFEKENIKLIEFSCAESVTEALKWLNMNNNFPKNIASDIYSELIKNEPALKIQSIKCTSKPDFSVYPYSNTTAKINRKTEKVSISFYISAYITREKNNKRILFIDATYTGEAANNKTIIKSFSIVGDVKNKKINKAIKTDV